MKVDVLIINYKSHDIINNCIESIQEEFLDIEIHILNNDPAVILGNYIKNRAHKIKIYESKNNIGYSLGVNFLVQKVKDTNYFFLLNPDAILTKNTIYTLLETLIKNNKIAAVSPAIYDMNNAPWFNYGMIDWEKNKIRNISKTITDKSVIENDLFNGCAVLFRKDIFLIVGGLHNELFMYFDEAFISMKIINMGYKTAIDNKLKIFHNVSYTTKGNSKIKTFYITRNGLTFFFKYSNRKAFVVFKYLLNGLYYLKHFSLSNLLCYYYAVLSFPILLKKLK
jgi:hypothetical protein